MRTKPRDSGLELADRHGEARERVDRRARHVGRQRREVELHVGPRRVGHGAREEAALVDAHGHRSAPSQHEIEADAKLAPRRRERVVGRDRARAAEDHPRLQMILQVFADAGQRVDDADAEALQQVRRADPRQLQQLRRLERAGAQDHFAARGGLDVAPALTVDDAARAPAVEQHARRVRVGLDVEVRARRRRTQVRNGGRAAQAAPGGQLVVAGAFLRGAVEVVVARNAELDGGVDERVDQRMPLARCPTPTAARRRRGSRSRRARCARARGTKAARRRTPSPGCPAAAHWS